MKNWLVERLDDESNRLVKKQKSRLIVMPAKLSTHVLDTANGHPARDMQIELWSVTVTQRKFASKPSAPTMTDVPEAPLLNAEEMREGEYEIIFFVGDYFSKIDSTPPRIRFLDRVPVRFGITDPTASYHVPLLCSPWSYSTYRGS